MRKFAVLLLLVLLISRDLTAQPYYFRHYQVENGLSGSTVFCSVQDRDGFLWFGTKEGLNRFDGYHFRVFSCPGTGLSAPGNDMIYCLAVDVQGTLWAGSNKGLFRFDRRQEKLVRVLDSLTEINDILADGKEQLWFLSLNKIYRYDLRTGRLDHFVRQGDGLATSICQGEDGIIWFATADGRVERFSENDVRFTGNDVFGHSPIPGTRWLQKICHAGGNYFLIGTTGQGLKLYDAGTGQYRDLLTANPDESTLYVRDIIRYNANEFWLATESGIFILELDPERKELIGKTNLRKKYLDPYSLSDNAVYSLCKDTEGGVWAGTFFGGVNYYSRQYSAFRKYYPDNLEGSISGNAVREICQDDRGNIWIGTEDAGLNKLDPRTGRFTQFKPGPSPGHIAYTNIHGLLTVGNELWIGTFVHGLDVLDMRTGKVIRHYKAGSGPNDLRSNFVLSIIRTTSGRLVLGSSCGVYWYDPHTDQFTPLPGIPWNVFAGIVLEDHAGIIWIGTHGNGVWYFDPRTGTSGLLKPAEGNGPGLRSGIINAILEDRDHNLWFSTEGAGLCMREADQHTWHVWTSAEGLPGNSVFRCMQDKNGDYWVTTSRGLARIRKDRTGPVSVYTRANGLLNDQFNYNSGFMDKEGRLYFGSVRGMITFLPDDFGPGDFTPAVYITGFQVGNMELNNGKDSALIPQSILYTGRVHLPYDRSTFSIDFAALSYAAPERTAYRYMLEGLDRNWTDLPTNRRIYFTNLAPGKYTFKLKAAVDGKWSDQVRELAIEISPPFRATGWAYAGYTLLLLLLVWYIISNYHRRTQIKKEKEIYEAKINFFANIAHEIRTPLTLIKGPVDNLLEKVDRIPEIRADVVTMERNTNRLIGLVTQILDFRRTETRGFSLDFTRINITRLLEEICLNFKDLAQKKGLDYRFEHPVADLYALADEEALLKIFSNLISNAVKYGEREVCIRLLPRPEEDADLVIEIINDGPLIPEDQREKIFAPFYQLKDKQRQKGTGIGLALARSLAELHGGKIFMAPARSGMNAFLVILPFQPAADAKKERKRTILPK